MEKKKLTSCNKILLSPDFDETNALKEHYEKLLERRQQLDILISNVQKTSYSSPMFTHVIRAPPVDILCRRSSFIGKKKHW